MSRAAALYSPRLAQRELGRLAQGFLKILSLDVAVPEEGVRGRQDLGRVQDEERAAALDGRVDRERRRLLGERDVERGQEHGPTARGEERDVLARAPAPER